MTPKERERLTELDFPTGVFVDSIGRAMRRMGQMESPTTYEWQNSAFLRR